MSFRNLFMVSDASYCSFFCAKIYLCRTRALYVSSLSKMHFHLIIHLMIEHFNLEIHVLNKSTQCFFRSKYLLDFFAHVSCQLFPISSILNSQRLPNAMSLYLKAEFAKAPPGSQFEKMRSVGAPTHPLRILRHYNALDKTSAFPADVGFCGFCWILMI